MINSFYNLSQYILGDLPHQFQFLNAILAMILAIIFFITILSPFICLFKKCSRW